MTLFILIIILLIGSLLAIGRANAFTKNCSTSKLDKFELICIFILNWVGFIGGLVVFFERKESILLDFRFKRNRRL